ncbi:putative late blight resistance protein -like protein R1B-14-like [Capsicum annuum]|nr:putative late blight resistance protein -like protein R1B-14-like [Capsicum annuum]
MPKDIIHHDKLFDLLARVGAHTTKVSTLVRDLEEKSRNEESTDETSRATRDLLENIELFKEDLKNDYLKAPDPSQCCFPMNDGPLFMHLLQIHLNDLLDSNAYSIALIKEEIGLVKEDVEFIKSFFTNIDQEFYKYLWARILDVAYEAKDVIDSIIVRDNGLIHFFFSLPLTIKKIKLIKEDVSNISEKIPKNKRLNVVNSPKKPVESKSLMGGKIIVGFKEETNWLIRKLTSGPASLDVISITGMPGSGKTTLAYKVYNDESVCSHFDLRAWCTVDQDYDKRKLLVELFNQDTTTWDDLTRPFPEVEKGSRIILTTRQKEVAFHGRGNSDPLNLRLLSPEESWKLLEKRKFGEQSCPDELLDFGKEIAENCKVLPLVAGLIAGVIAGLEKKRAVCLEVRNNFNYFIFNSEVDVMKVIELSYDHLSHHMKPCFLYLASFPKDKAIQFDALEIYWRAEGLAEQTEVLQISSSDASACLDLMPRIVTINYDKEHFGPNNFILLDSKMERHSGQHLYSLYIMGDKMEDRLSDACHLRELRLLRLLHLDPSFVMVKDSLLNEIGMLNHLRFLNIGTEVKSLPSSFSNLKNLESLFVDNKGSTWNSGYFRKVSQSSRAFICSQGIMGLFNRAILVPKIRLPKELFFLEVDFESSNTNDSGPSVATNWSWDFHFPLNLKKLVLRDFPLTSDSLSTITRLPNLENFCLERKIKQGEEWNMGEEDTFVNLKYLALEEVTLAKWEFGEESFPVLEKLKLCECRKLTEIPPNFRDIGSLKIIQLVESPQLEDSALEIKQYVEDIMQRELEADPDGIQINVQYAFQEYYQLEGLSRCVVMLKKSVLRIFPPIPQDRTIIGVKWVYYPKLNVDGFVNKLKERFVVKRYAQIFGVDYSDTFSPFARLDTIRLLLIIIAQHGWKMHQMDVESAFLNRVLEEEIYIKQPEGSSAKLIDDFKKAIMQDFEMSDLDLVTYFLGMEITQGENEFFICQKKYTKEILKKFKMENCKEMNTPMNQKEKLSKDDGAEEMEETYFKNFIGCLMHLTATRPDILCTLKKIVVDLHMEPTGSIEVFMNNQAAIAIYHNPVFHGKSKHFKIKFFFLRDVQKDGDVILVYCKTEE